MTSALETPVGHPPTTSPRWLRDRPALAATSLFLILQGGAALAFHLVEPGWPNGRLNWDAAHYESIARSGYPELPSENSPADLSPYAFYPLYPLLVRLLSTLAGLSIATAAVVISVTCATAAVVVAARWMGGLWGSSGSLAIVFGLALSPAFPVLQMAYVEGLALLLVVTALRSLASESYLLCGGAMVLLGFSRAIAAPFVVVSAVHLWSLHRRSERGRRLAAPLMLVGVAGLASFAWPIVSGLMAGRPFVYFDAMRGFRKPGSPPSILFAALEYPFLGLLVLLFVGLTTWVGLRIVPDETPVVLRAWIVAYPPYLVAVSVISTSPLRYLLLAFPIGLVLVPALARLRWRLAVLVPAIAVSIIASWWWVATFVPTTIDGTIP
ncbi:hypothetical protein [Oryzobacter telluris]|uniref:hypothetical protein n=1 Tax=Oryzobacter telluris TaxID=3149179 RepID=UPI00370D88D0